MIGRLGAQVFFNAFGLSFAALAIMSFVSLGAGLATGDASIRSFRSPGLPPSGVA
jgi:hypothetical protein